MSNSSDLPVFNSGIVYNIHTEDERLLKLEEDNSLSVNGKIVNFDHPSVQFQIERSFNPFNTDQEVFRILPMAQRSKYLAVSGQKVVLKASKEVADNSHDFIVVQLPNNDVFLKLQSVLSPSNSPTFITADPNGAVSMAGDSPSDTRRAWFRLVDSKLNIVSRIVVAKAEVVNGTLDYLIEFKETVVPEE